MFKLFTLAGCSCLVWISSEKLIIKKVEYYQIGQNKVVSTLFFAGDLQSALLSSVFLNWSLCSLLENSKLPKVTSYITFFVCLGEFANFPLRTMRRHHFLTCFWQIVQYSTFLFFF